MVKPRKTRPYITEKLLMGRKESNQTKVFKTVSCEYLLSWKWCRLITSVAYIQLTSENFYHKSKNNMNPDLKLGSHRSSLIWVHLTARIALEQDTFIRSLVLVGPRNICPNITENLGAQWLSGWVLDSRPRGPGFEPHRHHCGCGPWAWHIYPSLVLVQPRRTHPCLTERLLMGRKESKQTKQYLKNYWLGRKESSQ